MSLDNKDRETSFIVKVLSFKRKEGKAENLLAEASASLNKLTNFKQNRSASIANDLNKEHNDSIAYHFFGKDKYKLLVYDSESKDFKETKGSSLDVTKKTLLLIHGTLSSTHGSYGRLFDQSFKNAKLIDNLLEKEVFAQVIAFDHPTITHGAIQNVNELYQRLEGIRFAEPVDILSYSRGALVSKLLSADPNNSNFEVGKVLTFSGANGVGYFTTGAYVSKGLSILKKTLNEPVGKIITAIAQFSVDFFLEQPGCLIMTPKNPKLNAILDATPINPDTKFKAVVADWNKSLVEKWWKKVASIGLDAVIMLMLGRKHDWVVGSKQQGITPQGHSVRKRSITSMHTKNFNLDYVKPQNTHRIIFDYFK